MLKQQINLSTNDKNKSINTLICGKPCIVMSTHKATQKQINQSTYVKKKHFAGFINFTFPCFQEN